MAKIEHSNPKSVPGNLFVDKSCIDCLTCYHIAPNIFKADHHSKCYISKQPEGFAEWKMAYEALISCPVNSIGCRGIALNQIDVTLPREITSGIYYCGFTSKESYGATSYLIVNPQGNILVDSPRFNLKLAKKIEMLGGIKYMFLSHKDDVADHKKFREYFGCERIIHQHEVEDATSNCEKILTGQEDVRLSTDTLVLFSPGHTQGHLVLLYKEKYLFTGDQLFYDHINDKLYASKNLNWFSWKEQLNSIQKIIDLNIEWIFPGHGGWCHKSSEQIKKEILEIR